MQTGASSADTNVRFAFKLIKQDERTRARLGKIITPHGEVDTPAFMPVGTAAAVKAITHQMLEDLGAQMILANTYHLYLRPGHKLIQQLGGLHRFMSWDRAILTDSGGYQIFSQRKLRKVSEEGVTFKSHLDGSKHFISPELAIEIQMSLGSDICMALDECTPYPCDFQTARASLELTLRWAERCKRRFSSEQGHQRQALFGIAQGSVYPDLRRRAVERLIEMDFDGLAIGGLGVGEPKDIMYDMVAQMEEWLPRDRPRYLMGIGTPLDLVECVARGVDMFDCVLPTRNARNGCLFTSQGKLVIKNARYANDQRPADENCGCMVCRRYSRAYLRHLCVSGEMLSAILNTYHNLYFYLDIMRRMRQSIASESFSDFYDSFRKLYNPVEGL